MSDPRRVARPPDEASGSEATRFPGATAIQVTVNGDPHRLNTGTTVAALLDRLGHPQRGLAVAIDADVVPRSAWATTPLHDGATVEILAAAQGG